MTQSAGRPVRPAFDVDGFVRDGFLRLDQAFPRRLAEEMRAILWREIDADPGDPATWTRPVVRLAFRAGPPFQAAANTPTLHRAFDALVGPGRWRPQGGLGTFPVRFPSPEDPGDTGWHVDAGFGDEHPDFMQWRVNLRSRGRALLMLFLLSDVGEEDAPTRIRVGSHKDIARRLAPFGEAGLTLEALAQDDFAGSASRPQALAVGEAGTVYLCHPFLVHSAQPHRGRRARFLAQPPLLPTEPLLLDREEAEESAVERAIRLALVDR